MSINQNLTKIQKNMLSFLSFRADRLKFALICLFFALLSSACVKNEYPSGYSFEETELQKLVAEQSSKPRVKRLLGSPSATSDFGQETWYYIHSEYENVAFFPKKLKSQDVIAIRFDEIGRVISIKQYNEQNARDIAYADEITPTEGHDLSITEQLLGNLGRFNSRRDVLDQR